MLTFTEPVRVDGSRGGRPMRKLWIATANLGGCVADTHRSVVEKEVAHYLASPQEWTDFLVRNGYVVNRGTD